MTGILSYFSAGSREVTSDLWLIILPSSFIVALLVYSAVSMEVKDRARDIAILKTMGANDRQIRGIFFFQALALSVLGALVGILIGIIVSYGISTTSSSLVSNSVFTLKVTEVSMMIAFISATVAGLLGSVYPIYTAVRQTVREALR
jgi:ABC-type antimicrobial peptide transport system permease subunit